METPEHKKLNLGCGHKKLLDNWNVDIEKKCNPDQVVDLEVFPWPFDDDFFEEINADNILEHLGQSPRIFTKVIQEMYRVSSDKATWKVCYPHHRCDHFYDDYTHVRALTVNTFKMFDQKINFESIAKKLSDSTFGLNSGVDLEIKDVRYNITGLFREQLDIGMLGSRELEIKLNTISNVCDYVELVLAVHKPGRYENWYSKIKK